MTPRPAPRSPNDDEIDFSRLFGVLIDYKWLILGVTAVFAVVSAVYVLLAVPKYRASGLMQLELPPPVSRLREVGYRLTLDERNPAQSEIAIIRSRMVLGKAVDMVNADIVVEPKQLPLIGDIFYRMGVERPGFADSWGFAWAGETLSVESMPVADGYLGKPFTLEVLDKRTYALYYQDEKLGEGMVGSAAGFLNGDVGLRVSTINAPAGAEFSLTHVGQLVAVGRLRANLSVAELGEGTGILSWHFTSPDPQAAEDTLRAIMDVYVAQHNGGQTGASTVGEVRVLDVAAVSSGPVKPSGTLVVLAATLLGCMVAVGIVLLRVVLTPAVETQDQLEALGLSVYAVVPLSALQKKFSQFGRRGGDKGSPPAEGLLARLGPADASIEALRSLCASLQFGMRESADNRVMIAGPCMGVGKSFIAANLGAVCTRMGLRVLVIDGDMRRGHIHTLFQGRDEMGLSELLSGRATLDEVTKQVESMEGLHYISRGDEPPYPAELLATQALPNLMETVSDRYDLVLITSPPILEVTDAAIIGRQVGTTLLVTRFRRSSRKDINLAIQRLEISGIKVRGAVLNALDGSAACAYGC